MATLVFVFTEASADKIMAAKIAMMLMTTSNSIRVKASRNLGRVDVGFISKKLLQNFYHCHNGPCGRLLQAEAGRPLPATQPERNRRVRIAARVQAGRGPI